MLRSPLRGSTFPQLRFHHSYFHRLLLAVNHAQRSEDAGKRGACAEGSVDVGCSTEFSPAGGRGQLFLVTLEDLHVTLRTCWFPLTGGLLMRLDYPEWPEATHLVGQGIITRRDLCRAAVREPNFTPLGVLWRVKASSQAVIRTITPCRVWCGPPQGTDVSALSLCAEGNAPFAPFELFEIFLKVLTRCHDHSSIN